LRFTTSLPGKGYSVNNARYQGGLFRANQAHFDDDGTEGAIVGDAKHALP